MAECITKRLYGEKIYVQSAGIETGPTDPFTVAIMDEEGFDLSNHHPLALEDLDDGYFDLIVTLSEEAHQGVLEWPAAKSAKIEHWPIPDPSLETGNREQSMQAYRNVREALKERIRKRFGK